MRLDSSINIHSTDLLEKCLLVFVSCATIFVIGMRIKFAATIPLWLDETWSGMISSQSSWVRFWHESWLDCNPPLYYLVLKGSIALFGDSHLMLRLPSILFVLSAAIAPLVWRIRGLNDIAVIAFAAFLLLWPANLLISTDARGYGLMLLLSVLSVISLTALLEKLTLKVAVLWVALGTLMFLNHYYAAPLVAGQALVVAYRYKWALLKVWPAAVVAIPGIAWAIVHIPRLQEYARPDVTWYDPTTLLSSVGHLFYVFGITNFFTLAALIIGVMAIIVIKYRDIVIDRRDFATGYTALACTLIASAIGFALAIALGLFQNSLTDRYFTPFVPSAMLALAVLVQHLPKQRLCSLLMAFLFIIPVLNPTEAELVSRSRSNYGYEEVSDFIASYKPDQVVFLWDHPATKIMEQGSLRGIGGYFLKRAGQSSIIEVLVVPETANANAALQASFAGQRPAFIWLYDTRRRSAAAVHPPTFANDPAWACKHKYRLIGKTIGSGAIGCVKLETLHD